MTHNWHDQLQSLERAQSFGPGFIRPAYTDGCCFSNIPRTIAEVLGIEVSATADPALNSSILKNSRSQQPFKQVVFVLVDGMGAKSLAQHAGDKHVRQFLFGGELSVLTSQFPSTTSAHVTTIHSGLPVHQSGVYEWFYHEPIVGRVIIPLLFRAAYDLQAPRGALTAAGILPETLAPWNSWYEQLAASSVASFVYQSRSIMAGAHSSYSIRAATAIAMDCLEHGVAALISKLKERDAVAQQSYHYLYLPEFDGLCHEVGPDSPRLAGCVSRIFSHLQKIREALPPQALLLVTADHGLTSVSEENTIWIDREIPELATWVMRASNGEPLAPAGSARDLFLHIKPECIDDARRALTHRLRGKAEILSKSELVASGVFGSKPSDRLLERLGDIAILPHDEQTVWWSEGGKLGMKFKGHHGGLSGREMLIPLIAHNTK